MSDLFLQIDQYIDGLFVGRDPILQAALEASVAAGMPQIHISANQGKLLYLLAKLTGARRILELGTLAGYSTIWLARALPTGGHLTTLEFSAKHAEIARQNIERAGLGDRVEIQVGAALELLPGLSRPFDLVFIDADKENYPQYLDWSLKLTRPGSLILADNVIRAGKVLDPNHEDPNAQGARAFNAQLAADPRVEAVIQQQIGAKGHDGLAIARVR
jgi:predicted O-methyltransferase YrrM